MILNLPVTAAPIKQHSVHDLKSTAKPNYILRHRVDNKG